MKKLLIMACLMIVGCACGRKEKVLRQALADTNKLLTECRDQNRQKSEYLQKQHKEIVKLRKKRA